MIADSTPAERLDRAVSAVIDGETPAAASAAVHDAGLRPLLEAAHLVRTALTPPPLSLRFEARLGARLAESGILERGLLRGARVIGHPNRLLVGAAVGSAAAVGVGVTALAVWRSNRRGHLASRLHR